MSEVKRFRRKPTEINAIQWTGENTKAIKLFGANVIVEDGNLTLYVRANGAWLSLEVGEWIAKDFLGYYPIKNEAMQQNYEEMTLEKKKAQRHD